ncbi:MAG: hypothetical protein M1829_005399 [Trizodia sp. TS-e1964]|nr:MAG: hypothetical protein M1829_005399 [Trizodia sp. TS-e1964]
MLGENSYMNPYAMRYMPEETVDRKRVITESCWPYATEEMRKFKNDPDFRCNKRIYDGLLARTWPEVSDETYARYAPGQQNS